MWTLPRRDRILLQFRFLPALVSKTSEKGRYKSRCTDREGQRLGRLAFTDSFRAQDEPEIKGYACVARSRPQVFLRYRLAIK
jgi:hypothetical protein